MTKITIPNPCPMTLGRIDKGNDKYHCSSCKKNLIDFRDYTSDEIIDHLKSTNTCGIFYSNQVETPTYSVRNKFKYVLLTLLAVIGLNVTPINAQITGKEKRAIKKELRLMKKEKKKQVSTTSKEPKKYRKRRGLYKRRRKYRVIGTPSFKP
jgi:hypothetical protein